MKRILIFALCFVLCLVSLASCAITKREDVSVALIETTLHRENPEGQLGTELFPYGQPISDSDIKESAKGYAAYIEQQGNTLSPGQIRLKEIYVENLSKEEVYVRVIATFPAVFCKKDNPVLTIHYHEPAVEDSERGFTVSEKYDDNGNFIMTFTYQKPIAAGAMTYWPSLEGFGIGGDVTTESLNAAFAELGNKPFDVGVVANAITAKDYANAAEAFEAYDKNAVE